MTAILEGAKTGQLVAGQTQYRIRADNVITDVSGGWDAFATQNDAPHLAGWQVVGHVLDEYISDPATLELYRQILTRVRSGRSVTVPFRCDAPQSRRFMELRMVQDASGDVVFTPALLREVSRPPVALLDSRLPRIGGHIRMCSWCKKVADGARWLEVEDAVTAMGLFNEARLPPVTHGICPPCFAEFSADGQ